MIKSFPPFRLDVANQCLWGKDSRVSVAPKVFSVLEYLVRHAGRLVSQEELLEAIWPETYVQPEVLRKYVSEVRKALNDPAEQPRFVETSPKRGYRFIAAVHDESIIDEGGHMTPEANDLEATLNDLHADQKKVLEGQLLSIEEEIVERRLIAADTSLQVHDEVGTLRNAIVNLTPAHENAGDVDRKDRLMLEREQRDLTKEVREEQRDSWKDVQQLKREVREVEKELASEERQHRRAKDLL